MPVRPGAQVGAPPAGDLTAVGEFLQSLARAVRQFRTYPPTSPLCADAIAACHKAFASLQQRDRLVCRVTPRELIVDESAIGAATAIEQELAHRLHSARVAAIEIDRVATPRDLSCFCVDLVRCGDLAKTKITLVELLAEDGVEAVVAQMAHRPEVLQVGVPSDAVSHLVDHERRRHAAAAAAGPVNYLYPPDKGWVRVDPSTRFESISLIDLAVLVDDPAEIATMLLRLTDDDPIGPQARETALQQKFSDVAMLFGALDPHLARMMFGKLARAVLALEPETRNGLLRRTILPGLLDGRVDGAVLHEFPDLDIAESLCLLLDLETAAPEVLTTALDRLNLPAERRETVVPLLEARLQSRHSDRPDGNTQDAGVDRYVRRLIRVDVPGKSFAEFAAFDLSIDEEAAATIAGVGQAISATDLRDTQLGCLSNLVRLEPNPIVVATFFSRVATLFGELEQSARWQDLSRWVSEYRRIAEALRESRPDVAAAISNGLAAFCTPTRATALAELYESGADGRSVASALMEAFGRSMVPALVTALDDPALQSKNRSLVALMCGHASLVAPALAAGLSRYGVAATRVAVRVLGFAGAGYAAAIAEHVAHQDEQVGREALRALARIGTAQAASIIVLQLRNGSTRARGAAEEALWHFPPSQIGAKLRELLGDRDFVLHHPQLVGRLLDRAAHGGGADSLGPSLEKLVTLRFRVWNPAVVRVALKARRLLR